MVDQRTTHDVDGSCNDEHKGKGDQEGSQECLDTNSSADYGRTDQMIGETNKKKCDGDSEEKPDAVSQNDTLSPPESPHSSSASGHISSTSAAQPPPIKDIDTTKKLTTKTSQSKNTIAKNLPAKEQYLKKKDVSIATSLDESSSVISSLSTPNSSILFKSSMINEKNVVTGTSTIDLSSDTPTHRMKSKMNRRRNRRDYDSDDDSDDASKSGITVEKNNSIKKETSVLTSDTPTHRMKSRMNRRRNRSDYDSDDDSDHKNDNEDVNKSSITNEKKNDPTVLTYDTLTHRMKSGMNRRRRSRRYYDSDDDDDDSDSHFDDNDDNRTRRSQSTGATINSEIYNSVGAVAVYSTGVLVSQSPAVLTQPNEQELRKHEEEVESRNNPTIDAEVFASKEKGLSKSPDRSIPLGDDESSDQLQSNSETLIDATSDNLIVPSTRIGASGMTGEGKKKSIDIFFDNEGDHEKSDSLPCYWSPFLWVMIGALVVALGVIVALVLVLSGKESNLVLSTSPTMTPIVPLDLDPIKVKAFDRYIASDGRFSSIDSLKNQSSPQFLAHLWLVKEDNTTKFSDSMNEDEIGIMKTRYILAVFFYALQGEKWNSFNGWLDSNKDHCLWQFVNCRVTGQGNNITEAEFRPVTELRIEQNNLHGSLPNELAQLSKLEILLLAGNRLESVKVFGIGIDSLKHLRLNENPLQDHENIFRLTSLETLLMSKTEFSGTLPIKMQQLSNIRILDLSYNQLQGQLTNRFQTMSHLQNLFLDNNEFNSTLDEILDCGKCTNTLTTFRSRQNPLGGDIPESLFDFSMLSAFSVSKSKLTGTIPSGFGQLTALKELELQENYNFLDSNILPSEIGYLTNLEILLLSDSNVGGTLPTELSNLSSLTSLGIIGTSQTGSIANEICAINDNLTIKHSSGVNCSCPGNICELCPHDINSNIKC